MSYDKKCHKVHVLWTFCVHGLIEYAWNLNALWNSPIQCAEPACSLIRNINITALQLSPTLPHSWLFFWICVVLILLFCFVNSQGKILLKGSRRRLEQTSTPRHRMMMSYLGRVPLVWKFQNRWFFFFFFFLLYIYIYFFFFFFFFFYWFIDLLIFFYLLFIYVLHNNLIFLCVVLFWPKDSCNSPILVQNKAKVVQCMSFLILAILFKALCFQIQRNDVISLHYIVPQH